MTHCPHDKISILDAMNAGWVHKIVNDHACLKILALVYCSREHEVRCE